MRRSVRALLILVPLFGLQQFLTLYRPKADASGIFIYDVVSTVVTNLQVRALRLA
jgi:hypothetical protein